MSASAGARVADALRGYTRTSVSSKWALSSAQAIFWSPSQPSRAVGGCFLRQQLLHRPNCSLFSPHTSAPPAAPWPAGTPAQLRCMTLCAASKHSGASQAGQRHSRSAAADPRDSDEDARSSGSSSRQVRSMPPLTDECSLSTDGRSSAKNLLLLTDKADLLAGDFEEGEEAGTAGEGEYGEEEDDEEDGGDDYAASFLEPDDAPREVATGGTTWGEVVLRAAKGVLSQPAMQGLELYLFRALPASRKVDIRLDKLDDLYGSPSIDDIERFQRRLFTALEQEMGPEAAGEISFEVSSPGAERLVRVPDELTRFAELPLQVDYRAPDGKDSSSVLLLACLDPEAATSSWRLANVRANAAVKGRALSKRQLSQVVVLPLADIIRVRIHVDF